MGLENFLVQIMNANHNVFIFLYDPTGADVTSCH